ncbi:sigma 54-interacting transcriptional regulator [Klebsiella pneumoniae]|nr:sigma 54-interacting transcriptional regulator [Klebsiella pneumoniae]
MKKGVYRGDRRREGRFVEADGVARCSFDEIGDISPLMQVRLLRAIRNAKCSAWAVIRRLLLDVPAYRRTHRNLRRGERRALSPGSYYRLNVVDHRGITAACAGDGKIFRSWRKHFFKRYTETNRKTVKGFTPQAQDLLIHYPWPGKYTRAGKRGGAAVVGLPDRKTISPEREPCPWRSPYACHQAERGGGIQPLVEWRKR